MRDLRPLYCVGIPVASLLACLAVAVFLGGRVYKEAMIYHEVGILEHGTVLCLIPAVFLGVVAFARRRSLPRPWLGWYALLLAAGALYFAGEECSWGQNYFGWNTPASWREVNYQQETNLHNTLHIFNHAPRGLVTAGAIIASILPWILLRRRKQWEPRTNAWEWLLPTLAATPAAMLAVLSGLPQKLYGGYGEASAQIPEWFDAMFLRGQHNELKEFYLALYILMYLWSFTQRLVTLDRATTEISGREQLSLNQRKIAA